MKRIIPTLSLALCCALPAAAQTVVQPHKHGLTPEGITYFLPKTAIRFVLTATCTTRHPGPYAELAERFLGITDAVTTDTDTWTLDAVNALPYGIPDEAQAYTIALNPKTAAPLVTLTPEGLLIAVNDVVTGDVPTLPTASVTNVPVDNPDASDFYSEDFLRAGNTTKKAATIAEEIYDIRDKRTLIANGEADFNPSDGQQLQIMLQRQDAKEQALKSLFTGTTSKKSVIYIIDYLPSSPVSQQPLFRFSRHLGLVDNDDLSGEPYFLTITDETTRVEPDPEAKPAKAKKEKADLRYRIPGRAHLYVESQDGRPFESYLPIAQWGYVEHLGGNLFDKKFTTRVRLNPTTGGISHIDMAPPTK